MSVPGSNTIIAYGNAATVAASTEWTPFAAITDLTPPELTADDIETSHMTTPNKMKTYMPGFGDAGEASFTLQFAKDEAEAIYDLFRIERGFRIEFNDAPEPSGSNGSYLKFDGYIKSIGPEADREGLTTVNVGVKVSGDVEFIPAPAGA